MSCTRKVHQRLMKYPLWVKDDIYDHNLGSFTEKFHINYKMHKYDNLDRVSQNIMASHYHVYTKKQTSELGGLMIFSRSSFWLIRKIKKRFPLQKQLVLIYLSSRLSFWQELVS